MSLIKCSECNNEFPNDVKICPHCGNANTKNLNNETIVIIKNEKNKWSTGKLIIGIISIVLFLLITLQSCAAGIGSTLTNGDIGVSSQGFCCALFMLIAGIITVITRNSSNMSSSIVALIFYFLGAILTIGTGEQYPDLPIWGCVSFAFGLFNLGSILITKEQFKNKNAERILITIIIIIPIFMLFLNNGEPTSNKNNNNTNNVNQGNNSSDNYEEDNKHNDNNNDNNYFEEPKNLYELGETFIFDELQITIGTDISFTTVTNKYSDYYKKTIIKIPITVKNLKNETHSLNTFYYNFFGANGTETKDVGYYFDDAINYAGDLRFSASYTKYFYILYDANGTYAIEFDDWDNAITVEFIVTK